MMVENPKKLTINIRQFNAKDARILPSIYHEAVHSIGVKAYSKKQLAAWSPQPVSSQEFLDRVSDGRSVFVATNHNDMPIGFIELQKSGHIDCFYCHPNVIGIGVGSKLYDTLETAARQVALHDLYVEASEIAYHFFKAKGFQLIKRHDFKKNNIPIHHYLMQKHIRIDEVKHDDV